MLPSKIARFKFVPFGLRKILYHVGDPGNPHETLFQHIIGRAIMDSLGFTGLDKASRHNVTVRSARAWFKFGDNFQEYCENANIANAGSVRQLVLDAKPFLRKEL